MASTSAFTLTNSAWTQIGTGKSNFAVQFAGLGKIALHMAESEPGGSAPGFILSSERLEMFSASGLAVTDQVWAKAIDDNVTVTVIEY